MTKPLRLFNTLTGAIEPLVPLAPPEVGFYACGPTVYNRAHVGNFRTFVADGRAAAHAAFTSATACAR